MATQLPSSDNQAIQTLVNSISFQTSAIESDPPLNLSEVSSNLCFSSTNNNKTKKQWLSIFPKAAFFKGYDHKVENVVVMVYEDPSTKRLSTVVFTVLGEFCFNGLRLSENSRFYDAVKNLSKHHQKSNVRRAIAISLLKLYALLNKSKINFSLVNSKRNTPNDEWDEIIAGELASKMRLMSDIEPIEIGKRLLSRGFLQPNYIDSSLMDVVYNDTPDLVQSNNKLVYQLGEQLEKLFDPLTEYSPESANTQYTPPLKDNNNNEDDEISRSICKELLQFQESISTQYIRALTKVVIPLREKSLKGTIPLKISELNEIFPPTIDEVTRINCILLDALKIAINYGSFEVVRACGITIPYFYKAYMRHEAALKTFSPKLKAFLAKYEKLLPSEYRTKHIDSVLHASLNLIKLKLILERLIETKKWDIVEKPLITTYFSKSVDIIDSFGRTTVPAYDRRIFTPSGKILTEICEGWPSELSYGWLRRKVVSVFESKSDGENGVIILFNDYIIFASLLDTEENKKIRDIRGLRISDVIMSSLINEEQLTFVPSLKVTAFSLLQNIQFHTFDVNHIKTVVLGKPEFSAVYQVESASLFLTLINKAKIMGKLTPFHLFRDQNRGFSVAHEMNAYINETIRSRIVMFLNFDAEKSLLLEFDLFAALFVKFIDDSTVEVRCITADDQQFQEFIDASDLSKFVFNKLLELECKRNCSVVDDLFDSVIISNKLVLSSIDKPWKTISAHAEKSLPTIITNTDKTQIKSPDKANKNKSSTSSPTKETVQTLKKRSSLTNILRDMGLASPSTPPETPKKEPVRLSEGIRHTSQIHRATDRSKWHLKAIDFDESEDEDDVIPNLQQEIESETEDDQILKAFEASMVPLYDEVEMGINWGLTNHSKDD